MTETEPTPTLTETMSNNKVETAKMISKFVIGRCVSGTVVTLIHNNTTTFSKSQKVQLYVGAYIVGSMVAKAADTWTDEKIDQIADLAQTIVRAWKRSDSKSNETVTETIPE